MVGDDGNPGGVGFRLFLFPYRLVKILDPPGSGQVPTAPVSSALGGALSKNVSLGKVEPAVFSS